MLPHDLRAVLCLALGRDEEPSAAVPDSCTLRSTPESGRRAERDEHKRTRGSKLCLAVDRLGHLPALHVATADTDDRAAAATLADTVQEATGQSIELADVDQGYTGESAARAAAAHGIQLEAVELPEAIAKRLSAGTCG